MLSKYSIREPSETHSSSSTLAEWRWRWRRGADDDDDDDHEDNEDEDGDDDKDHGVDDTCQVTMKEGGSTEDKFIRNLHKGDFFGEKALSGEEVALMKKILSELWP